MRGLVDPRTAVSLPCDCGIPSFLERCFAIRGPFDVAELIEDCEATGVLDLSL